LDNIRTKISELESATDTKMSGASVDNRLSLETQVKGKLPIANLDTGPIVAALKAIVAAFDEIEHRSRQR
jgi:hypothetical protein